MNLDSGQIDRIVREVMRQIMSLDRPTGASTDLAAPAQSASPTATPPVPSPRTLVVADRVVTMASLAGRLVGVTRVQVTPRAVVTPLVTDLLRDQGIRLERQPSHAPALALNIPSILLVADGPPAQQVTALLNQLAPGWQRQASCRDALNQVAGGKGDFRAIIVTEDWAHAVCQANRDPQLRAAAVTNTQTVRQACQQLDANVVVMDPTQLTGDQLQDVVREYVNCTSHRASVSGGTPEGTTHILKKGPA